MGNFLSKSVPFNPSKDIPDLSGKVIFITGGNAGIGKETIRQLAAHKPATIYMAARTQSKAEASIDDIKREVPDAKVEFIELDLTRLKSVEAAAKDFTTKSGRLDILLNNAGIMNVPYSLTEDGYEIQLGTNHLGHALLTKLLLPTLLRTAEESNSDVRIVNLSSEAHNFANFSLGLQLDAKKAEKNYTTTRYGVSKLANMLHARALSERYPTITATSIHPGVIDTGLFDASKAKIAAIPIFGALWNKVMISRMQTVTDGALNSLWAATAPKATVRESFYWTPVGKKGRTGFFSSKENADRLWNWTEAELKRHGY